MTRPAVAALALAGLVATVGVPAVAAPSAANTGCAGVRTSGPWTTIDLPSYSPAEAAEAGDYQYLAEGGDETVLQSRFATYPGRPTVLLYTDNGQRLLRSRDGGCSWQVVLKLYGDALTGLPVTTGPLQIDALNVPAGGTGSPPIVMLLQPASTGATKLIPPVTTTGSEIAGLPSYYLATSRDGGTTWKITAVPADCTYDADMAAAAHVTYVSCGPAGGPGTGNALLYSTKNDGAAWTSPAAKGIGLPNSLGPDTGELAVDPRKGSTLIQLALKTPLGNSPWAVRRSTDGGKSWHIVRDIGDFGNEGLGVVARHPAHAKAQFIVWNTGFVDVSGDGGRTWNKLPLIRSRTGDPAVAAAATFTGRRSATVAAFIDSGKDSNYFFSGEQNTCNSDIDVGTATASSDLWARQAHFATSPPETGSGINFVTTDPRTGAIYALQSTAAAPVMSTGCGSDAYAVPQHIVRYTGPG